jgi:hypothetical protein
MMSSSQSDSAPKDPAPVQSKEELQWLLQHSAYLPGAGSDWMELADPLATSGCAMLVVADYGVGYADYSANLEQLERHGISLIKRYRAPLANLLPAKWVPPPEAPPPEKMEVLWRQVTSQGNFPIYEWLYLRTSRIAGQGADLQVLYLSDEAHWIHHGTYMLRGVCPKGLVLPRKGGGSRSWLDFHDPEGFFARAVMSNPAGTPEFVVQAEEKPHWPEYTRPLSSPAMEELGWWVFARR